MVVRPSNFFFLFVRKTCFSKTQMFGSSASRRCVGNGDWSQDGKSQFLTPHLFRPSGRIMNYCGCFLL